MSILSFHAVSCATPDGTSLFDTIDLSFSAERTGVVGRNGSGKSTLLRLATGELAPLSGTVTRAGTIRVLRQELAAGPEETVAGAFGVAAELAQLRRALAGEGSADDVAEADWTLEERLAEALAAVGLAGMEPERPLSSLSGGQRTRIALAALTFDSPDMILLDEPTNNLDADGRALVGRLLAQWRGGAMVVSHDRALLRQMDRIVELSSLGAKVYGGSWNLYAERKAEELANAEAALASAERQAKLTEQKIQLASERKARRDAAGQKARARGGQAPILLDAQKERAEQSGGRGGNLAARQRAEATAALDEARANVERARNLSFALPGAGLPAGRAVLAFDHVTGGYDPQRPVVRDVSFSIVGPERVAVTGPNGSGKTTVLRLAAGDLAPLSGTVVPHVPFAMLDQHVRLLDPDQTLVDNFRRINPQDNDNTCRAALARFLFRADEALKTPAELSGGEKLRAGLACVLGGSTPPALLILDEPTNHLDLHSVAAIESALERYDGALLVVSHDEDFLENLGIGRRIALA